MSFYRKQLNQKEFNLLNDLTNRRLDSTVLVNKRYTFKVAQYEALDDKVYVSARKERENKAI